MTTITYKELSLHPMNQKGLIRMRLSNDTISEVGVAANRKAAICSASWRFFRIC